MSDSVPASDDGLVSDNWSVSDSGLVSDNGPVSDNGLMSDNGPVSDNVFRTFPTACCVTSTLCHFYAVPFLSCVTMMLSLPRYPIVPIFVV